MNKCDRKKVSGIVFFLVLFSCTDSFVLAKVKSRVTTDKVLEVSLMSLQESAREVFAENQRLGLEISSLQTKVDILRKQLKSLEQHKGQLQNDIKSDQKGELQAIGKPDLRKGAHRLREDIAQLNKEIERLEQTRQTKQSQRNELQENIDMLVNSIARLRDQPIAEEAVQTHQKEYHKGHLMKEKAESMRELQAARGQYEQIHKKYGKPIKVLENLKTKKNLVKQKLTIIEDEYKILLQQDERLNEEIDNLNSQDQSRHSELLTETGQLELRQKQLEQTLKEAKRKIEVNKLDFGVFEVEDRGLQDNFNALTRENQELKANLGFWDPSVQ